MSDLEAPLKAEERQRAAEVATKAGADNRWSHEEIVALWKKAKTDRGPLAIQYAAQRGLDLNLIGPDEMRTGHHQSTKGARPYPALMFPGTNDTGTIDRVQSIRFHPKALEADPPEAKRLNAKYQQKITNGGGTAPLRLAALPDAVDDRLLICEGPEDAFTLRQVTGCETWAMLSVSVLGRAPVPADRNIVVFTDLGSEDQTRNACVRLAMIAGMVWMAPPPTGFKDVNEALVAGKPELIIEALEKAEMVSSGYETLPCGYRVNRFGWIERQKDDDWIPICRGLKVLGLCRDGASKGWGQLAEITAPDRRVHRWIIPAGMLVGTSTEALRTLADLGVEFAPKREELVRILLSVWRPNTKFRSVDRLGWTSPAFETFALPDGELIASVKTEPVAISDKLPLIRCASPVLGELADWKTEVAALAVGNPLMVMAACAAISGPLLEPMGEDGGGFHMVGESSRGKTTVLLFAVSIWGPPAMKATWRATSNGLEGRAKRANGTCLFLDEMGEVDPKNAAETAYMLGNGAGKGRAERDGSLRETEAWQITFLSTGEIGLADKLLEGGQQVRAGQAVRLIDIPATTGRHSAFDNLHGSDNAAALATAIKHASGRSYGHAGRAFVSRLMDDLPGAVGKAHKTVEEFLATVEVAHPDADGQVIRVARRFGVILAAGRLAIEFGILPWKDPADEIMEVFELWVGSRGGTAAAEERAAVEAVRGFIAKHGDSRFERFIKNGRELSSKDDQRQIRDKAGFIVEDSRGEPQIAYISSSTWQNEVTEGLSAKYVAKVLDRMGALITEEQDRLNLKLPQSLNRGRARHYAVRIPTLEGVE